MSLFDVIKYRGINLGRVEDLLQLPEDVLTEYWSEMLYIATPKKATIKNETKAGYLANHYIFNTERTHSKVLMKILSEYNQ